MKFKCNDVDARILVYGLKFEADTECSKEYRNEFNKDDAYEFESIIFYGFFLADPYGNMLYTR